MLTTLSSLNWGLTTTSVHACANLPISMLPMAACSQKRGPNSGSSPILEGYLQQFPVRYQFVSVVSPRHGGGSPSLLTVPQMDYLFDTIQSQFELDVCNDNMFAFEIAPHHIDTDKVDFIASSFINRVSVGVQSFNRGVQRAENRPNPSKEYITFILGYLMASLKDKLSRINVDLMIGLDGQDVRSLKADLKTLTGIGVPRITVYANRKPRPEEERVRFEQYVVSSLLHLEQFFPTYDLITNRGGYQVPNWFIRKGFRNYFKKFYRTHPYLNSNLAFGYKAHSFISPRMFWYHKEADGYLIDHDSSRGICRSDVFRSRFEEGRRVVENKVDISYYAF